MFDPNTRFLVVDDFKTMRTIVKKTLSGLGYTQIDEAEDGKVAHAMVQKALSDGKPYGCVVSDWNMPNTTGLEFLKLVRASDPTKGLPFILVTAENEQSQVIEAVKAGVSNYLVKPFTPADFQKKLEVAWAKHFKAQAA
ncbi:MAG: response regulator [Bdellovibrionaceae bacterium]|nr:response regulator [Pseudobdellovibrionaceae bacterium]